MLHLATIKPFNMYKESLYTSRPRMGYHKKQNVLLIEDNELDSELIADRVLDINRDALIKKAFDGKEAISYLRNISYFSTNLPDIILLDLDLPKIDGFEILAMIETLPSLHHIPIAITSGSSHYRYIRECYKNLNIINFIPKPCRTDALKHALSHVRKH